MVGTVIAFEPTLLDSFGIVIIVVRGGNNHRLIQMKSVVRMLNEAVSISIQKEDDRHFRVGSIAIRGDGALVKAYNGAPKFPDRLHHSEGRLCRKLDRGAIVYVARTTKDGQWAMSKPCANCERALRRCYVKRVYYTIGPAEYGCVIF